MDGVTLTFRDGDIDMVKTRPVPHYAAYNRTSDPHRLNRLPFTLISPNHRNVSPTCW